MASASASISLTPQRMSALANVALQFLVIALDQAAENGQLFDLALFLFFQGGQDLLDALFLGVADKAAGVDHQPVGILVFGNDLHAPFLQHPGQHFAVHRVLEAAQADEGRAAGFQVFCIFFMGMVFILIECPL